MLIYKRNTHFFNPKNQKWEYREDLANIHESERYKNIFEDFHKESQLELHFLSTTKYMSLEEIIESIKKANEQEDVNLIEDEDVIQNNLDKMVISTLVKVKEVKYVDKNNEEFKWK